MVPRLNLRKVLTEAPKCGSLSRGGRLVQTTGRTQHLPRWVVQTPWEMLMRMRKIGAALFVAALAVAATSATGASGGSAANTLTVWLQVDAQSGWADVVAAANAQFETQNPGWDVDVQYQTWPTHLQLFDAALAGWQRAGRHRDGEHRDDEVHGRRRLPGSQRDRRSRTRAPGSPASPSRGGTAGSCMACPTTRGRA